MTVSLAPPKRSWPVGGPGEGRSSTCPTAKRCWHAGIEVTGVMALVWASVFSKGLWATLPQPSSGLLYDSTQPTASCGHR